MSAPSSRSAPKANGGGGIYGILVGMEFLKTPLSPAPTPVLAPGKRLGGKDACPGQKKRYAETSMAYQVFARKYRPQTFDQVVGQEHITQTLQNAITMGRLAQAYLFVGPRGTGKTSTARILAKALNATDGPKVDFDPSDEMAKEIAEGNCMDVLEIDGASNNGVEQVRDLRDNVRYAPAKGRFKIYIIDEVHMLSVAAFNALLKTLEEPPAHVKFLFATTEVHKLPATILSRCQRFDLRRIPEAKIAEHLAWICGQEEVEAEAGALAAIARYAEGGLRDAESALDQVISFFGEKVTEADVLTMFGLTGLRPVAQMATAIASGDTVAAMKLSRELITAGKDLGKLSQDLLRFFRNVTLYQISPEVIQAELPKEEAEAVAQVASLIRRQGALAILEELSQLESRLRYALAKDVLFEVALIQLSQLREKVSLERILSVIAGGDEIPSPSEVIAQLPVPEEAAAPTNVTSDLVATESSERDKVSTQPAEGRQRDVASSTPSPPEIERTPTPSAESGQREVASTNVTLDSGLPKEEVASDSAKVAEGSSPLPPSEVEEDSVPPLPEVEPVAQAPEPEPEPVPPPVEPEPAPAPVEAKPTGLKAEPVAKPRDKWEAARAKFREKRELESDLIDAMYFLSCRVNAFEIAVPTAFENKMPWLRGPKNAGLLKELLEQETGGPVELAIVERDDPHASPKLPNEPEAKPTAEAAPEKKKADPEEAPRMTQEEYENDPLIKQAMELFDAKIAPAKN